MFVKYSNFNLEYRNKVQGTSFPVEYVLKGTVEKTTKFPFCKEKTKTIDIFLCDGIFWRYTSNEKFVSDGVEHAMKIWKIKNNKKLSTID